MRTLVIITLSVLLGPLTLYSLVYGVRKRYLMGRRKDKEDGDTGGKTPGKGEWGVPRDSYCYPEINDVMGFDFVKVVRVDDALTGKAAAREEAAKREGKAWLGTHGIRPGTVSAVTAERRGADEDQTYGDEESKEDRMRAAGVNIQEDDDDNGGGDLAPDDLIATESIPGFAEGWADRDDVTESYYDQMVDIMRDGEERGVIEEPADREESDRIARQGDALDKYLQAQMAFEEANESDEAMDQSDEIMRELSGLDMPDDGEATDIPEEDLPEI